MGGELAVGFSREVGASTVLANRNFTPLGVTLELRSIAPVKAIISLDIAPRFVVKSMGVRGANNNKYEGKRPSMDV